MFESDGGQKMEASAIVERLKGHKGQHVPIQWERTLKTLKGVEDVITKRTFAYVRAGIDYANLASVREGIESGEREEVQPLPASDVWVEFPFILRNTKTGEDKVRLYPATFTNLAERRRVEYFINGQPATFEQVRPLCRASEFPTSRGGDAPACFTIKAKDVLGVVDLALPV
jgi:hypothetical protein